MVGQPIHEVEILSRNDRRNPCTRVRECVGLLETRKSEFKRPLGSKILITLATSGRRSERPIKIAKQLGPAPTSAILNCAS